MATVDGRHARPIDVSAIRVRHRCSAREHRLALNIHTYGGGQISVPLAPLDVRMLGMDYDPRLDAAAARFVSPFYLKMLHGNLRSDPPEELERWLRQLHTTAETLDPQTAGWFLGFEEWRGRMSISWMIGLRGWHQFTDQIGRLLVDSEQVYAGQGTCLAQQSTSCRRAGHLSRRLAPPTRLPIRPKLGDGRPPRD